MVEPARLRLSQLPLRWRLTLWYLLTLSLILLLFAVFLFWQVRLGLLAQVDAGLELAATQALVNVDADNGQLSFQNTENAPDLAQRFSDDIGIFLLAPDGAIWSQLGQDEDVPDLVPRAGKFTLRNGDDVWRVHSEFVTAADQSISGWLLVMQSLDPVNDTLLRLSFQLLWGLPLTLFLAGAGGFFLAVRALRPIEQVTRTAQEISASDMSGRIAYDGPADEVGRLATTFNTMLDRLQASFEQERRFTGDAAHELRTPLTALKGWIGVTLSKPRPAAEYTATLAELEVQVDRLIHLSNDLLYMARLDQQQRSARLERVALSSFMTGVIAQVASMAEAKQVALTASIPAELTIRGDIDLLIRLFLNLMDNAIKYTPEGGRVTVTADAGPDNVTVTVTDTGPGIPAESLRFLFERFYRVEGDRSRRGQDDGHGGAGLGLAIAREIAMAHGGQISVQSTLGEGSSFFVQLPRM